MANSTDPDQTQQNAASDQVLYCLPYIQQCLETSRGSRIDYYKGPGMIRAIFGPHLNSLFIFVFIFLFFFFFFSFTLAYSIISHEYSSLFIIVINLSFMFSL